MLTMSRKEKSKRIVLPQIRMYWDDFEKIYNVIKKNSNKEVIIESEDCTYSTISEVRENVGKYVKDITITGMSNVGDIRLTISPSITFLRYDKALEESAAFIEKLLIDQVPWFMKRFHLNLALLLICLYAFAIGYFAKFPLTIIVLMIMLGILATLFFSMYDRIFKTKIYTTDRNSAPIFWDKHKEFVFIIIKCFLPLISAFIIYKLGWN